MDIDPSLLKKLRCMLTGSALQPASPSLIDQVNANIQQELVRDFLGRPVSKMLIAALVNEDQTALYPIVNGAPQLVREELIPLTS